MRNLDKENDGLLDDKIAYTPYAIKNDVFDIENFQDLKAHSKKLLDTESEGKKEYEVFPDLQQDMFDALFKYDPEMNPPHAIKREDLLNKKIMEEMLETPRYKELRAMTQLDIVNSTIGTELLSDQAMELVKKLKKERKALQDVVDAGNALDQAQAIAGQGQGQGHVAGDGSGRSKEEIELEEAERIYEEAMENFEEAIERKDFERELDRMVAKVQDEVHETSEAIANWGLGASTSFQKKSPHEKMELVRRLRNSDKLKQIAKLAGRFRRLAQVARKEKVKQGLDSVYSITQGDEISRLLPNEIMRLLLPITRIPFLMDLLEKKTLVYEIQGKQKKGKGPVIICIDSSGSMDGIPEVLLAFYPNYLYNNYYEDKKMLQM